MRSGSFRFAALVAAVLLGALLALGWMTYSGRQPPGVDIRMAARDAAGPDAQPAAPAAPLPSGGAG
ncbi:MAG TPA: hypothetical protein VF559_03350 [Caulobacteraceae bacterium]